MADQAYPTRANLPRERVQEEGTQVYGHGDSNLSDRRFAIREVRLPWQGWLALSLAVALGLALLGSIEALLRPLALLFLSITLAVALAPLVDWLSQYVKRSLAVVAIYLAIAALIIGLFLLVSPPLVQQVQEVRGVAPNALDWINQWIERIGLRQLAPMVGQVMSASNGLGSRLLSIPMTFSDGALDMFLVIFLSLYALISGPRAGDFLLSLFPEEREHALVRTLTEIGSGIGGYVRGVFIMALFIGIVAYIGLRLIGAPYPLVLSVVAALLEIVPVLGTTISTILITGVAFTASVSTGLITFAFLTALQLIEGNILFPNIVGRQSDTSPLLSLFAFFAGPSVGGILGALLGVPIAVTLRVMTVELIAPQVRRWTGADSGDKRAASSYDS